MATIAKSANYPVLLKQLIIQGLIKIEEQEVEVQCRAEDKDIVSKVLPDAVAEFSAAMKAAGHKERGSNPKVTVSSTAIPSKACSGGVILTAARGRIVLNQTLDE